MVTETDRARLDALWQRVANVYGTDAETVRGEISETLSAVWREPVPVPEHPFNEAPSTLRALHEEPPSPDDLLCYLVHWLSQESDSEF